MIGGACYAFLSCCSKAGAMMNTASGILALNSLAQLKESGWFDRVMAIYPTAANTLTGRHPPSFATSSTIQNDRYRPFSETSYFSSRVLAPTSQ
jgi:hypothetical protein